MNKFTKVLSDSNMKQYKVAVTMLSESVQIDGSFTIKERTLSLAKEKALSVVKKNEGMKLVDIQQVQAEDEAGK